MYRKLGMTIFAIAFTCPAGLISFPPAGACQCRAEESVEEAVRVLQAVQPAGLGTAEARAAMKTLTDAGEASMLPILKGFGTASPLAANWLRNAFETTASQHVDAGGQLPREVLLEFIRTTNESPVARRLAYEWMLKKEPELKQQLIPDMLLDPGPEFRRDAIAMLIETAQAVSDAATASELYRQALAGAVHKDQLDAIAAALRKYGDQVDIRRHLGFLAEWQVIGPFDNREEKGFAVAYAPESVWDPNAEYEGQLGPVRWQPLATDDDYGILDIAKQLQNYKGSVMYATTTFHSDQPQSLELRLGTPNAWKLWVNGRLLFEREEYHRSTQMDQYRIPVTLDAGVNRILIKVCQNEQTQDWAQSYHFQLRMCDATGAGVLPVAATALIRSSGKGAN